MQNRILSSESSSNSDENSLNQSHIQQIFNLQNQFLQSANNTSELQNISIIKSVSNKSKNFKSDFNMIDYKEQLNMLSQQITILKQDHREEIETLIQQKDITISQMENQFQNLLLQERQSYMVQDQGNNGERDELKKAIERCNKVTDEQYHKMEQVKMKLAEKNHEYNLIKQSFDKEQKTMIELKEEVLQLRIENHQAENQSQLLKVELQSKQHGYIQYEDVINDSLKRTKEKLQKCEQELSTSQLKVTQSQHDLQKCENEKQKIMLRQQLSESETNQMRQRQQELVIEIQDSQKEIRDLNQNYLNREQEWREKELLSEDFRMSTTGLNGKVQNMELIIIEHKKEINALKNGKQELTQNLRQLRETIFGSIGLKVDYSIQVDLVKDLKQMDHFVSELRDEKCQMEELLIECKQLVTQLEKEKLQLLNQSEELSKDKNKMQNEHELEIQDLRVYVQQSSQQTQLNNQLKLQLKEARYEKDQLVSTLENKIRDKELNLQQIQIQLQIYEKDNKQINIKNSEDQKLKFEERFSVMEINKNEEILIHQKEYQHRIRQLEEQQQKLRDQHAKTVEQLQDQYQQRETFSSNQQTTQQNKLQQDLTIKMNEKDLQIDIERQQLKMLHDQLQVYEQLEQRESVHIKDRQQLLERDLFEANKQKAQLICQVSKLQKELDSLMNNLEVQTKSDDKIMVYKKENDKLHQMIDRLTDQLLHAEGIAQTEQRNSVSTKFQVESLLKEKMIITERFQSHQMTEDKVSIINNQMSKLQVQMKHNQTLTDELKDEKLRSQRMFNELSNDHDQLYQQYKDKESEAFELNKLYVDLLQQQTDRQTSSVRMIQALQASLEDLKEEIRSKDAQINRYREQVFDLQQHKSQIRISNRSPPDQNFNANLNNLTRDEDSTPAFQPSSHTNSRQQILITPPKYENKNIVIMTPRTISDDSKASKIDIVTLQIYQDSQIEQIKTRLKQLKTKIVSKLTVYQELIKKKLRTQTKQQIHYDLQQFREELIQVFEGIILLQSQREKIFNGAVVQLRYNDLQVQDEMNNQIMSFSTFIESFNQLVSKTSEKKTH